MPRFRFVFYFCHENRISNENRESYINEKEQQEEILLKSNLNSVIETNASHTSPIKIENICVSNSPKFEEIKDSIVK